MRWDYGDESIDFDYKGEGLFILCEGNFQYGNATLSFYDPEENLVQNEVFFRANGMRLGDVAQSMTIYGNRAWIVVNNSHVIFAIDPDNFKEIGRIENLTSPRYIHFINPEKAYVTQIWDNRIFIINPKDYSVTGYIEVPEMKPGSGSTEQMVQIGKFVYCNCWSYQDRIIKIDTDTDEVIDEVRIGKQPNSLTSDCQGRLWTLTDGAWEESDSGIQSPALFCIDPENMSVIKKFEFQPGDTPSEIQTDGSKEHLYWINNDIWEMAFNADSLPLQPLIRQQSTKYYGLTINPYNGEIYVADAIDYMQQGIVYRFSPGGIIIDDFYVGVTPGAFCWK